MAPPLRPSRRWSAPRGESTSRTPERLENRFSRALTRCWLALGRIDEAGQAAAAAATCAEAFGLRLAAALADRAVAAVALTSRELDTAAEKALASATAADAVGVPIEAALSRMLAGRALAQMASLSGPRPS